jgi:hypothetical protein
LVKNPKFYCKIPEKLVKIPSPEFGDTEKEPVPKMKKGEMLMMQRLNDLKPLCDSEWLMGKLQGSIGKYFHNENFYCR